MLFWCGAECALAALTVCKSRVEAEGCVNCIFWVCRTLTFWFTWLFLLSSFPFLFQSHLLSSPLAWISRDLVFISLHIWILLFSAENATFCSSLVAFCRLYFLFRFFYSFIFILSAPPDRPTNSLVSCTSKQQASEQCLLLFSSASTVVLIFSGLPALMLRTLFTTVSILPIGVQNSHFTCIQSGAVS